MVSSPWILLILDQEATTPIPASYPGLNTECVYSVDYMAYEVVFVIQPVTTIFSLLGENKANKANFIRGCNFNLAVSYPQQSNQ